tara:strand:- start:2822 stop:3748 length:927 start_codon:yes stop_codon:yes gene_type:complete
MIELGQLEKKMPLLFEKKAKKGIVDCFMFRDEWDLLKLRIRILKKHVDSFLIVEALNDHLTGAVREKFLNESRVKELEEDFPGIVIEVYQPNLEGKDAWQRENEHRNKIFDRLEVNKSLEDDDVILISDCDEIPNPEIIPNILGSSGFVFLNQMYFVYFLDSFSKKCVTGTICVSWATLKSLDEIHAGNGCQALRNNKDYGPEVDNGGWHYSYLGGVNQLVKKATTIAEGKTSYDKQFFKDQMNEFFKTGNCPYSDKPCEFLNHSFQNKEIFYYNLRFSGKDEFFKEWTIFPNEIFNNISNYSYLMTP